MASQRGLLRLAIGLLVATAVYNVLEGAIAITSGLAADSITLVAFGADSYLEVLAAGAVLWRLSFKDEGAGERAEARALRFIFKISFTPSAQSRRGTGWTNARALSV